MRGWGKRRLVSCKFKAGLMREMASRRTTSGAVLGKLLRPPSRAAGHRRGIGPARVGAGGTSHSFPRCRRNPGGRRELPRHTTYQQVLFVISNWSRRRAAGSRWRADGHDRSAANRGGPIKADPFDFGPLATPELRRSRRTDRRPGLSHFSFIQAIGGAARADRWVHCLRATALRIAHADARVRFFGFVLESARPS
jgi:hypothetical protein